MNLIKDKKKDYKKTAVDYIIITAGTFFTALGLVMFLLPYNIVAGGVSGLSVVFNYLFGWWLGAQMLIYNVVLFAVGFKLLGLGFGIKSIYSAVTLSIFADLMQQALNLDTFIPEMIQRHGGSGGTDIILMSAIYGAVISGFGMGLVIWRGATTGGTDIIAMIFNKYMAISVGAGLIIADAVITFSSVVINPMIPMYGLITIFIVAKVIDAVLTGLEATKTVLIISQYHDKIKGTIYEKLDRGITYIKATGGYTQQDKNIVMVTISRSEIGLLKKIINECDSEAFVVVLQNSEALGYGFKKNS